MGWEDALTVLLGGVKGAADSVDVSVDPATKKLKWMKKADSDILAKQQDRQQKMQDTLLVELMKGAIRPRGPQITIPEGFLTPGADGQPYNLTLDNIPDIINSVKRNQGGKTPSTSKWGAPTVKTPVAPKKLSF